MAVDSGHLGIHVNGKCLKLFIYFFSVGGGGEWGRGGRGRMTSLTNLLFHAHFHSRLLWLFSFLINRFDFVAYSFMSKILFVFQTK